MERAFTAATGGEAGSSGLYAMLRAVAPGTRGDDAINADRLGKYLSKNAKVVVGDKRLVPDRKRAGAKLWRLEIVPQTGKMVA
jgi:hypothetical protein